MTIRNLSYYYTDIYGGIMKIIKDIYNKGNFKDYFKRNKVFLIISAVLVILSLITAYYSPERYGNITQAVHMSMALKNSNTLSIFTTNLIYMIYTIVMGLSFSVMSVINVIVGCVDIGVLYSSNNINSLLISNKVYTLLLILANIFALTGAFLVTKFEIRLIAGLIKNRSQVLKRIKVPLKDVVLTLTFIIVLLVVSSLIALI